MGDGEGVLGVGVGALTKNEKWLVVGESSLSPSSQRLLVHCEQQPAKIFTCRASPLLLWWLSGHPAAAAPSRRPDGAASFPTVQRSSAFSPRNLTVSH